jgi:tripartite-type tricarboxylate transporter receptor subunit TctC
MNRKFLVAAILGTAAIATAPIAAEEVAPGKQLRVIVGYAPGGGADMGARFVAKEWGDRLKRTVVVENKPGAGGNLAARSIQEQPADGSTLLLTSNNHTINPLIYKTKTYDAAKDFAPVILVARGPAVIVVKSDFPARTLKELIEYSKKNPNKLNYGSGGVGTPNHVAGESLKSTTGIDMGHVPYKGSSPAITDLVGGRIDVVLTSPPAAAAFMSSGQLRAIAVTSTVRWPGMPDVPTVAESGYPDYSFYAWLGLFAPKGTPAAVVDQINSDVSAALNTPEAREKFMAQGYEVGGQSAADFAKFIDDDIVLATRTVREAKIQAE